MEIFWEVNLWKEKKGEKGKDSDNDADLMALENSFVRAKLDPLLSAC